MRTKPSQPTKSRILFFLFFLSINSYLNSHAQELTEKAAQKVALTTKGHKSLSSYSIMEPSLVLFSQKTSNRLNLTAKEVKADSSSESVFVSPRLEFALGDFAYVGESERAMTDYRPAGDVSISLTGSVNLIRYSSDAKQLSIRSDLLAIDLLNKKITGAGSVKLLIGDSIHTGATFSIEQGGILRLGGETSSRIEGEFLLTAK